MPPKMKMPSVMTAAQRFAQVPHASIERSTFDRSHAYKTTFDSGVLVPFFLDEALPGDTFNLSVTALARLTTPLKPIMDNIFLDFFFFFVPNRLLWDNWERFNGAQDNPGDSTSFTIPVTTVPAAGYTYACLEDYLGFPTYLACTGASWTHSALPTRAYFKIYNDWFRDENLCNSVVFSKGNGPDAPSVGGTGLRKRGKRHDYFAACLPWPQKGTAVSIPLGTTAPVIRTSSTAFPQFVGGTSAKVNTKLTAAGTASPTATQVDSGGAGNFTAGESLFWNTGAAASGLMADLTGATAATINSLRQAFQIQKMLERDARGGTRYIEILKAHFGVTSPDARLQRAEYLGGGSVPVNVSPLAQTTQTGVTGGSTPIGNLAAYGAAVAHGVGFSKSFVEHGIVIGIMSARADLTYSQGIERPWSRSTRYDFYWPALAHIGEQAVLQQEIATVDNAATNASVFGYQERYAEYRYKPSRITGKFRSITPGTLDIWHLSEVLSSPALNQTFIEAAPPIARVSAVPSEPQFYFDSWIKFIAARPLPVFGVPGMIDHF